MMRASRAMLMAAVIGMACAAGAGLVGQPQATAPARLDEVHTAEEYLSLQRGGQPLDALDTYCDLREGALLTIGDRAQSMTEPETDHLVRLYSVYRKAIQTSAQATATARRLSCSPARLLGGDGKTV